MKWWKKWLSFLFPIHLESVRSDFNESLDLSLVNNRLRLTTLDAIYSFDDRYYNFYRTFRQTALPRNGSNVLVLGLGLGSIPYMLEKRFYKQYHYTAVEIDEAVLYLFGKYQQKRLTSSFEIIQSDAADFMAVQEQKFQLICIDIFIGETIPTHIKTDEFIRYIKASLTPSGRVLWNMLYATKSQVKEVNEFIEYQFSLVFPDFQILEVLGNVIITNRPWGGPPRQKRL